MDFVFVFALHFGKERFMLVSESATGAFMSLLLFLNDFVQCFQRICTFLLFLQKLYLRSLLWNNCRHLKLNQPHFFFMCYISGLQDYLMLIYFSVKLSYSLSHSINLLAQGANCIIFIGLVWRKPRTRWRTAWLLVHMLRGEIV